MLLELRVHNFALIEAAELELGSGLTVFSGETGAGKTALLSSLKLLVGERSDSSMVGKVSNEARIEAVFYHCVAGDSIQEAGEDPVYGADKSEHLVVRRISREGRSRCYVNDSLVTVGTLQKTFGSSLDLYGQHEHQSLLRPAEHLRILDEYGDSLVAHALQDYQERFYAYHKALTMLQSLQELSSSSAAERELAAFTVREITKIAPEPGEYETLESELPRLQNSEQLASAAFDALSHLRDEGGALENLENALRALEVIQGYDSALNESFELLQNYLISLEEVTADVSRYAVDIEHDPELLQVTLDRLGELDGLSKRFGPGMSQVFELLHKSERLLQSSEDSAEQIKTAEKVLKEKRETLISAATKLATQRAATKELFLSEINRSIASLELSGAQLSFEVRDLPFEKWTSKGSQDFELLYRPAPNTAARPLLKIASGGELSRVMLAIKSLLQTDGQAMTLVFDEIDAGVGGKTAWAVAERLAHLARQHQVIVITHLAQIAAVADHHFLVSKVSTKQGVQTKINTLSSAERVKELARMLSGSTDQEALVHAKKLLTEAQSYLGQDTKSASVTTSPPLKEIIK